MNCPKHVAFKYLCAVLLLLHCVTLAAEIPAYDLERDFGTNGNPGPNGWSFGTYAQQGDPFQLLSQRNEAWLDSDVIVDYWTLPNAQRPGMYHNQTGLGTEYNEFPLAPGHILGLPLHPPATNGLPPHPPITNGFPGQAAGARFVVPTGGLYRIENRLLPKGVAQFALAVNGRELRRVNVLQAEVLSNHVFLVNGDVVDCLATGDGGVYSGDLQFGAQFFFLSNAQSAPIITQHPQSVTFRVGSNAVFTAGAQPFPVTCQWFHDGQLLPGQTNFTLAITNLLPADAGGYHAVAANAGGNATSSVAFLTLDRQPYLIATSPPLRLPAGFAGSIDMQIDGEGPLYCHWFKDGEAISGATSNVLTFESIQTSNGGSYVMILSNAFGSVTSAPVMLTVTTGVLFDVVRDFSFLSNPHGVWSYGKYGHDAMIYLVSTNHTLFEATNGGTLETWIEDFCGPVTFLIHNPTAQEIVGPGGYGASEYPYPGGSLGFLGQDTIGCGWHSAIELKMPPGGPGAYKLVTRVRTRHATRLALGTYFGVVGNFRTIRYDEVLPGAWVTTTNLLSLHAGDSIWLLTTTPAFGEFSMNEGVFLEATLDVWTNGLPPSAVVGSIQTNRVRAGQSTSFEAQVTGAPVFHFRWLLNGVLVPGQTNLNLYLPNVQPTNVGSYSIVVSNHAGVVTGLVAVVEFDGSLVIMQSPENVVALAGAPSVMRAAAIGAAPLSYQWRRNGTNVAGANSSTLFISACAPSDAALYDCVVANSQDQAVSASARLNVVSAADFDVERDFSVASNPNGAWLYGPGNLVGSLRYMPAPLEVWDFGISPAHANIFYPQIYHNQSTNLVWRGGSSWYYPGGVVMFPGYHAPLNTAMAGLIIPSGGDGIYRIETIATPHSDTEHFGDIFFVVGSSRYGYLRYWALPDVAGTSYSNQLFCAAGDTFTFSVISSRPSPTGLRLQAKALRVSASHPMAPELSLRMNGTNGLLKMSVGAWRSHEVFYSTNLADWMSISTNVSVRAGTLELPVPTGDAGHGFFKVVSP